MIGAHTLANLATAYRHMRDAEPLSRNAARFIAAFAALPPDQQEAFFEFLEELADEAPNPDDPEDDDDPDAD